MPEAAHNDVSITIEGIMVLGFTNRTGIVKCTLGVPETDDQHQFQLKYVTSDGATVIKPITARSSVSLIGPGASAGVGKVTVFNQKAIDWKDDFFHKDNSGFLAGYKFQKCLEVFNGEFKVETSAKAEFRTGTSGPVRPREVVEKASLVIQAAGNQQVVFVHDGEMIILTDKRDIEITNICTEKCVSDDFQFYYCVFDVPREKRLHAKRVRFLGPGRDYKLSINLPCWFVVYDEPTSGPFEP
jgi:hypothetical protein